MTTVAALFLGAAVLTSIQLVLQLRGDVKERRYSDRSSFKTITMHTRKARYILWWGLLIGMTIGQILHDNPDLFSWAPNWLRENSVFTWRYPGYDVANVLGLVALFLTGFTEYRWYKLNCVKIDEHMIEVSWQEYWRDDTVSFLPGFRNFIIAIDWANIKTIWMSEDGGVYAETLQPERLIAGVKLPKSAMPTSNDRIYRILAAKEVIYPVDLDAALVRFGGEKYGNTIPGWTAPDVGPPVVRTYLRPVKRPRGIKRPGT